MLVEPDATLASTIDDAIRAAGLRSVTCSVPRQAADEITQEDPDLVVTELAMPGLDGISLFMDLQRRNVHVPVIMLSEPGGAVNEAVGLRLGVSDWLTKPFDVNELVARAQAILRRVLPPVGSSDALGHLAAAAGHRRLAELEHENRELRQAVAHDALTGLYSRRYFDERLRQEMERAISRHRPLALVLADIDKFKQINDQFGHSTGDLALRTIGKLAQQAIRKEDCPARVGGDEFALLLPDTSAEQATVPAERWRSAACGVELPPHLRLSLSVGIAQLAPADSEADLFGRADRAMYVSKHSGGNVLTLEPSSQPALLRPVAAR